MKARKNLKVEVWNGRMLCLYFIFADHTWKFRCDYPIPWTEFRVLHGRRRIITIRNDDPKSRVEGFDCGRLFYGVPGSNNYYAQAFTVPWLDYYNL